MHSFAAAVYFSTRRSRLAWLLALGAFSLAGALHIQLRARCEQLDTTILPYADRHAVDVIAHVTKDGRLQQNDFGESRQSIDVEAEQIPTASTEIVPTHSGIRLNVNSRRTDTEDRSLTAASKNEIRVFHYGERLRLADLRVAMPSLLVSALAVGALLIALWTARRRALLTFAGPLTLLLASPVLAFLRPRPLTHPNAPEVRSIDVGEGDATLLVTPQGRTLLIDAGGSIGPGGSQLDFGEDVISPYLWSHGISRLDVVAITHGHSNHIEGMIAVLKNFRSQELWAGLEPPSFALRGVITTAHELAINVVHHWEGDEFELCGVRGEALFPPADWTLGARPQNNDSLVLQLTYGKSSVLLEGDAEKQVERRIAALHHPTATLLKVGHHGSANATTAELVDSAKPAYAVISVGSGNSFGLPRMTLKRLADSGTRVYRTDIDGAVTFYLDERSVTPSLTDHP